MKKNHSQTRQWSGQSVNRKTCWNVHPKCGTVNFS